MKITENFPKIAEKLRLRFRSRQEFWVPEGASKKSEGGSRGHLEASRGKDSCPLQAWGAEGPPPWNVVGTSLVESIIRIAGDYRTKGWGHFIINKTVKIQFRLNCFSKNSRGRHQNINETQFLCFCHFISEFPQNKVRIIIRGILGGISAFRGDPNSTEIGSRRDLKLRIFSAEGAENFESIKVCKEKLTFLEVLRENLAKFWSI